MFIKWLFTTERKRCPRCNYPLFDEDIKVIDKGLFIQCENCGQPLKEKDMELRNKEKKMDKKIIPLTFPCQWCGISNANSNISCYKCGEKLVCLDKYKKSV